jgi:hypothetical protein
MAKKTVQGGPSDSLGIIINDNFTECYAQDATLQDNIDALSGTALMAGIPFRYTEKIVSTAAGTAVPVVPVSAVPAGKKVYLTGILVNVSGSTAWTDGTAATFLIVDTAASPLTLVSIVKAGLTGNRVVDSFAATNVTTGTAVLLGAGAGEGCGLSIKGNANYTAGSDIYVTLTGYIA